MQEAGTKGHHLEMHELIISRKCELIDVNTIINVFNPRGTREGYGSRSILDACARGTVVIKFCVCVIALTATYLVYTSKMRRD